MRHSNKKTKLDEIFEKDQLLFIERNGLGIKNKRQGFENNEQKIKLKRPNSKVLEDLERIRLKKMDEKLKNQLKEEENKIKLELKKKSLQKQIKKRNVALGITKVKKINIKNKIFNIYK